MIQLRQEQIDAFRSAAQDDYEDRAVAHLRGVFPSATADLSEEDLLGRVRDGTDRARRYGLRTEFQAMAFVDATFLAGRRFDEDPEADWARVVLRAGDVDGDEKARLLLWAARATAPGRWPT